MWNDWSNQDQHKLHLTLIRSRRDLTYILAASLGCGQKPAEQLRSRRGKGDVTLNMALATEQPPGHSTGLIQNLGLFAAIPLVCLARNKHILLSMSPSPQKKNLTTSHCIFIDREMLFVSSDCDLEIMEITWCKKMSTFLIQVLHGIIKA